MGAERAKELLRLVTRWRPEMGLGGVGMVETETERAVGEGIV